MATFTQIEKGTFLKLFNRGGYVLDFSTNNFDVFTMESIGVPLCEKYKTSKGKSLTNYINSACDADVNKLLVDLFNYYEIHYEDEYSDCEDSCKSQYNIEYKRLYKKCKELVVSIKNNVNPLSQNADNLKSKFSSEYLSQQIDLMLQMQSKNPTEAIGKAKELIESCCKTILDEKKIKWDKNWDVGKLASEVIKNLKLMPNDISNTAPAAQEIKSILGNLRAIATNLASLRNPYGSGHGKSASYKGLEERHAKLAVGSSITFVDFLWDTYERRNKNEV